jgi:hypothetical protein
MSDENPYAAFTDSVSKLVDLFENVTGGPLAKCA